MIRAVLITLCLAGPVAAFAQDDLQTRAEAGDMQAQTELALRYHAGDGVLQDYATAARWAKLAASAGDARAQNLLGRYYHQGWGVSRDPAEARRWLSAAAETGTPEYLYDLGVAIEADDPATAARAYETAARAGHAEAAVSLGVLVQDGRGVPQDFDRARALYEPHAAAGHPRALNNLGLLYVRGDGVAQDYERAAQLFTAAAEQGQKQAMVNLGVLYENGFGVPLDEARAIALYRQGGQSPGATTPAGQADGLIYDARLATPGDPGALQQAARAGDPIAMFQLAWLLAETPEAPHANLAYAARLFEQAALSGHAPSMANLAVLYFEGRGLPQDYVLGQMWRTLANQAGLPEPATLSARFAGTPTPAQITEAQALAQDHPAARK